MTTPRIALVTGAAQGIGRAISLRLADDGYDVAVNDLSVQSSKLEALASKIRTKGRKSIVLFADVSSEEDVENMVERTVSELGGLDVVRSDLNLDYAYSAHSGEDGSECWYRCGHIPPQECVYGLTVDCMWAHVPAATVEDWNKVFLINVKGTLLCYKAAAKAMIRQKRGGRIIGKGIYILTVCVIHISPLGASSVAGKKGENVLAIFRRFRAESEPGEALHGIYSASKFSVRALTQVAGASYYWWLRKVLLKCRDSARVGPAWSQGE